LATLAAFRQQPKAQHNDKQIHSLENHVPYINVPAKFNQHTSESACEHRNRLKKERYTKQCTKSTEPSKTPQDQNIRLRQEW
jgi:hypothetical protein